MWAERVAAVRASGTASLVTASAGRWFGPGFVEREPERASALLHALRDAADEGYLAVVRALAAYDVRDRLGEIAAPVLAVAGAHDAATARRDSLRAIAEGVRHGRLVVLDERRAPGAGRGARRGGRLIRGAREELAVGDIA